MFQHCLPRFKIFTTFITYLRLVVFAMLVAPVSVEVTLSHVFPAVLADHQLAPGLVVDCKVVFGQLSLGSASLATEVTRDVLLFLMDDSDVTAERVPGSEDLPAVGTEVGLAAGTGLVLVLGHRLALNLIPGQLKQG